VAITTYFRVSVSLFEHLYLIVPFLTKTEGVDVQSVYFSQPSANDVKGVPPVPTSTFLKTHYTMCLNAFLLQGKA
jgi:hypothetical protein